MDLKLNTLIRMLKMEPGICRKERKLEKLHND